MFENNKYHRYKKQIGRMEITPQERQEFKDAVKNIRAGKARMQLASDDGAVPQIFIKETGQTDSAEGQDPVEYRAPGLQKNKFEKLRRGQIKYKDELDLHGESRESARRRLEGFLAQVLGEGVSEAVLIIHGKGKNSGDVVLLKNRMTVWLRSIPEVLGYTSAKLKDGGTGALYVLLKKRGAY